MAENDVEVRFGANIEALKEGIEGAKESLKQIKEQADSVGESFKSLAEIAGIALTIDAFKEWIDGSAELGENMTRLSAQLGATVPQVSELSAVSKLTGTSFEGLVHSVERMQLRLTQAGRDTSATGQALHVLGINAREFAAVPIPEQLERMAEAFSRFADGPTKTAAAMALLGRSGAEMIPFLDRGKEGLDELREVSARTGAVMSTEMARAFGRTKEDLSELSLAWQGLSNRIFQVVNQAIDAAIKGLTKLIESMDVGAVRSGVSALTGVAIDLVTSIRVFSAEAAAALDALMVKIGQAVSLFEKLYNVETVSLKVAINPGGAAADVAIKGFERLRDLSKDISDALTGAGAGGTKAFGDLGAGITPLETKINDLRGAAMMLKKEMNDAMGGAGLPGGRAGHEETSGLGAGKPQVPVMDTSGARGNALKEAVRQAEEIAQGEIHAAERAAKGTETTLDEELKAHAITMAQWLQQTLGALDHEQDAVQDAYAKELATAGLTSNEKLAILNREAQEIGRIAEQEHQAMAKAAEQSAAQWKSAADSIAGAINGQVSGLLKGTETIRQAFANMAQSMIEEIIKFFVKWTVEQAAMIVASAVTGRSAAAAGALPGIMADVGQAFAGFSAFFAPTLGPGAPAAAAGLAAGIQTTALGMASADIGGYVQSDGLAMIHQGEVITPASLVQPYNPGMGASGGGSVTHNWNISAVDARSFAAMLSNSSSALAKAVRAATTRDLSLRPEY